MRRTRHLGSTQYIIYATSAVLFLAAAGLIAASQWPDSDGKTVAKGMVITGTTTSLIEAESGSASPSQTSTTATAPTTTDSATASTAGSTTSSTAPVTTTVTATTTTIEEPSPFDADEAMGHIYTLAEAIGPRKSGTAAEDQAVEYAVDYLEGLGYPVTTTDVPLPNGSTSHNVSVIKPGHSSGTIVIGGHIDSVTGAPGGNDNASGAAVVLELARCLKDVNTTATLQFVLFGAEEMVDTNPDHHHYGSRQFVADLTPDEQSSLLGMISVDMVAVGTKFHVRTMKEGPQEMADQMLAYASDRGIGMSFLKDLGSYGWSDHEPFELAGYPAAWAEWRSDPYYHTSGDTYSHCKSRLVATAGQMIACFLVDLNSADLSALAAARDL